MEQTNQNVVEDVELTETTETEKERIYGCSKRYATQEQSRRNYRITRG